MHDHHIAPFRTLILFLSTLAIITPTIYYLSLSSGSTLSSSPFSGLEKGIRMGCVKNEIVLSTSSKKTIAIIGAGVSGLQAARTILTSPQKEQFDVIIFEARDRIGGRAWTNHLWKFPLDFGNLLPLETVFNC
jgi:hypothetical protein